MKSARLSVPLLSIAFIVCLVMLFSPACTRVGIELGGPGPGYHHGGPPPHAPAHGYRAKYRYYYYPSAQVYFDVTRKAYFYMEGGRWRMSVSLPEYLRVRLGSHVTIDMDTDKPYTHFAEHKKKYPPSQLKKKDKKKKWWK